MSQNLKTGKRPPKNAPALKLARLQEAGAIPEHPTTYDSISGWGGWHILGNDSFGDCVGVTWATVRRIVTRLYGTENYPSMDQVLKVYRTQNPNFDPNGSSTTNGPGSQADGGMDIQTLLELLVKEGGPDGVKALAFAKVDHTNLEEMKAALALFNFLWIGCLVTQRNEQQFSANQPWDYNPSDRELGGHSITGTGYDQDKFDMETWAKEAALTNLFVSNAVDEAWVVIWPEFAAKMTQAQRDALEQAYGEITGGKSIDWSSVPPAPDPTPQPTPEPTPTPGPTPTPSTGEDDQTLAEVLHRLLEHHHDLPHYGKDGFEAWLAAKGL